MAHKPNTNPLNAFTVKSLCPTAARTYITAITRRVRHVVRALAYAKSVAIELFNKKGRNTGDNYSIKLRRKKKKKLLISSLRLCCSRSFTYVTPVLEPHEYYDSSWNSVIPAQEEGNDDTDPALSGYLRWLEEKDPDGSTTDYDGMVDDIDRLAEKFIENCHEKFRLEKQESYRRYQEMLARSM